MAAVILDLLIGDPVYAAHPVRLIGRTVTWFEDRLRAAGRNGYGGGIALFLLLFVVWVVGTTALLVGLAHWAASAALGVHLFLVYSLLAMRDLLRHASAVEKAASRNDLDGARQAISRLVGRDTNRMDLASCRRAAIESLSENLTDGFVSPLFWYAIGGVPGLLLFKVVSTMDSMVGYKTPRYLYFGWCGARLDDWMNFLPARITWLMIATAAGLAPGCSLRGAFLIGWRQHAVLPGPNSGWSEAATAGAIRRKLVGPIWTNGNLVTEVWLGDPMDAPAESADDFRKA
ncbi:MAG: adenosylcobinamide-phosphate synthase CbiB, partial [Terriglobia bacterium]